MSALSIDIRVAKIDSDQNEDPKVVNETLSFEIKITSQAQFRTIYHSGQRGGDDIAGFLYVPKVSGKGCNPTNLIPKNVTRQENLPQGDYSLVGYAPWISEACSKEYLQAANDQNTKGFIFYPTPSKESNITLSVNTTFDLPGGYDFVGYPVYAIDPFLGGMVMERLSQYSGNVTDVYMGHNLTSAGMDPQDYIRVFADIKTENSNPMPGLWLFLLIVVAVLLFIVGLTSLVMHLLQYRHRQNLRRRVANGEVDLEALGVKRLTVPREILSKFPITIFVADPPTPSVPTSAENAAIVPAVNEGAAGAAAAPAAAVTAAPSQDVEKAVGVQDTPEGNVTVNATAPEQKHEQDHQQQQQQQTAEVVETVLGGGATSDRVRGFSQSTCPICLDDFVHQQTMVRELPCMHVFHPECIDPFLETQSSLCPLCKKSALPRGYVPSRLTNATVRRERVLRRLRQRSQNSNNNNGQREMQMESVVPPPQSATIIGGFRLPGRRTSVMRTRALSMRPTAPTEEDEQRHLESLPRWRRIGGRIFPALLI